MSVEENCIVCKRKEKKLIRVMLFIRFNNYSFDCTASGRIIQSMLRADEQNLSFSKRSIVKLAVQYINSEGVLKTIYNGQAICKH